MRNQKRIWEIQHQTVCKVIGMALDFKDLKKIATKFGIAPHDPLMDREFALHSTTVHLCGTDNKVARHVQKIIEGKFAKYAKRLAEVDALDLISGVTEHPETMTVPLWAILWDLSTRGLNNGTSVETALFGFIHMLEHRLLKEYWKSAPERTEKQAKELEVADESMRLKRKVLDLQQEVERTRKLSDDLRSKMAVRGMHPHQPVRPMLPPVVSKPPGDADGSKVKRLQSLLDESRSEKRKLEKECARLRAEIQVLAGEAALKLTKDPAEHQSHQGSGCPLQDFLQGKHITMVGGLDSLERHYRDLIKEMGGTFFRHDGDSSGGECLIENCIGKADLVVCPIEVNSHNAAKSVKKLCKSRGIPCCFPRTAGLSGFRMALEEHYREAEHSA
jgi:hypothetical protein